MDATTSTADEPLVAAIYHSLLDSWNRRSPADFAALFAEDALVIGFDGSQMSGPAEIDSALTQIFAGHQTAAYVGKVRRVRFLTPTVALLDAVAGMVPPGQKDLNPAVNTIQSLVAVLADGRWRIAHYQNTPAQFHSRPDLSAALTDELRQLLFK